MDQSPEYKLQNVKKYKGGHLKKKDAIKTMVSVAIKNAEWHGINIHHGTSNNADGNCIFESIIDNINSRPCFREFWSGSEDYLRKLWLEEAEVLVWNFCGLGMPEEILRKEWGYLKNGRTYECDLGDFVLHAVAHCVQKDILIFNTQISQSHEPISVVEASHLANRPANSDIPLTLAYNGVHYESLVPDTDVDIEKTIGLRNRFVNNVYEKSKEDILCFKESLNLRAEINLEKLPSFPCVVNFKRNIQI